MNKSSKQSFFEMGSEVSRDDLWSKTYNEIESKHNEVYNIISEAITLEEQEKPYEALDKYKKGIETIDDILKIQVSYPETPDSTWEKARLMIQKIKKTRAEVLMRITTIQPTLQPQSELESPPTYYDTISISESSTDSDGTSNPKTYSELASALQQINIDPDVNMYSEIIYRHEGVKLYFISSTGVVSSFSEPETLIIALTEGENAELPKGILQIGNWIYPLVPGASPCFRTEFGAFIFPDIYSNEEGASVGIILPPETDAQVYNLLENILHGIVGHQADSNLHFNRVGEQKEEDLSGKISDVIVKGAWYLSWGLIKGAEKLGDAMNYGTPKLINMLIPYQEPTEVNPKVVKGMQIAENTTKRVANVTGYVAEQVGSATMKLGSYLAPHIQKQGTRMLSSGFNMSEEEAAKKVNGILTVAAGAVEGFSTIYHGLETSAGILGENLKNNSVKIVEHKYGTMAGEVAGDTLGTVGHIYTIGQHSRLITPKGFVKKAAKGAGKGIVYQCTNPKPSSSSTSSGL